MKTHGYFVMKEPVS